MTKTLLHFGYAKTATTYLQRHVFPGSDGIRYLGKPFDLEKTKVEAFVAKHLGYHIQKGHVFDPFFEDEDVMRVKPYDSLDLGGLEGHLRGVLSDQMLNVWSHEGYLRPGRKNAPLHRKHAIANMRAVFEAAGSTDINALIVLRDTKKMLKSSAVQFHRDFDYLRIGDLSLQEVADFVQGDRRDRFAALLWRVWYEYLDYASMIDDLIEGFGAAHVYVLKYEEMVRDWQLLGDVIEAIHPGVRCHFPDTRENTTQDKPYDVSAPIAAYLQAVEAFDLSQIYPGNGADLEGRYFKRG